MSYQHAGGLTSDSPGVGNFILPRRMHYRDDGSFTKRAIGNGFHQVRTGADCIFFKKIPVEEML
jgi:hypothetical protein